MQIYEDQGDFNNFKMDCLFSLFDIQAFSEEDIHCVEHNLPFQELKEEEKVVENEMVKGFKIYVLKIN